MKIKIIISVLLINVSVAFSQSGGQAIYKFLDIPTNARAVGLGGYAFALADSDLFVSTYNPALIDNGIEGKLGLSYMDYFGDMKMASAAYPFKTKKFGVILPSIQFLSYGKFIETDEYNNYLGEFNPFDLALSIGTSKKLANNLTGGINLKLIHSNMYQWKSLGIAADAALNYYNPDKKFCASLILRNAGTQIIKYRKGNSENLPTDIVFGMSKKLANAPFRLMMNVSNMNKWNLKYENPNFPKQTVDPLTGDTLKVNKWEDRADNFARHLAFGLEFAPSNNFHIRMGYNYRTRQEMKVLTKTGMIGFSWGFGLRVKKFYLSYGRGIQHLAGPKNVFTISTNINDFAKKTD